MERISPMLATLAPKPFDSDNHYFEVKYDGARAIAYVDNSSLKLLGRNGTDYTPKFPELANLPSQVKGSAILDGELVVMENGKPNFGRVQSKIHSLRPTLSIRAEYVIFDILYYDGKLATRLPLAERRELLHRVFTATPDAYLVPFIRDQGIRFFQGIAELGLEGIMAKSLSGLYHPGKRTSDWLKVKPLHKANFLVGGYTYGEGSRAWAFGSLLLGEPTPVGLRYVGSVGTGFDDVELGRLMPLLKALAIDRSPFVPPPHEPKLLSWMRPELAVRVAYAEITNNGKLRFPAYKGEVK